MGADPQARARVVGLNETDKAAKYCHEKVDEIRLREIPYSLNRHGEDTAHTRELRGHEVRYDCTALLLEAIGRLEKLLREMKP